LGDAWLAPALRWTLAAFLLLGAGIVLGGFWAYKVLGWGGYWGWDPVENASLVPWLVAAALVHGIVVQNATGALRRTNWALALAGYVLVLYATFLTRSGVLADFSVHSFPAGSIYWLLTAIVLGAVAVSAVALVRRLRARGTAIEAAVAWPFVLTGVIVLLAISATLVLVGTSWPMISSLLGEPAVPAAPFYNRASLPLYVALLALLAIAPVLGWGAAPARSWIGRAAPGLVAATAGTVVAFAWGARGLGTLGLFFAALAALTSNLIRLVRVGRARPLHTGAALSHVGFALMLLGIVSSSSWGVSERIRLPLGHPVDALDRIFTFRGHVEGSEPQDLWRVAVMRPGEAETTTHVAMFTLDDGGREPSVFRRPAILRGWGGDLYIAPMGIEATAVRADGTLQLVRARPASYGEASLTFLGFDAEELGEGHGMRVVARVRVERGTSEEIVELAFGSVEGALRGTPVSPTLLGGGTTLAIERMSVEEGWILVLVRGDASRGLPSQVLTAEVSTKPLIGLLWAGTLILGVGCVVAVARRYLEARDRAAACEGGSVRVQTALLAKTPERRRRGRVAARRAI
jgi:cytochrome c-type biogenesis protein CcmF